MQVALCLALFHVTNEIIRMSNGFHGTRCSPGTEPKQGARTDCIQPMSCTDPEIYSGTALSLPRCPTVLYCSQLVVTNMQLLGTSQPETLTPAWTVVAKTIPSVPVAVIATQVRLALTSGEPSASRKAWLCEFVDPNHAMETGLPQQLQLQRFM